MTNDAPYMYRKLKNKTINWRSDIINIQVERKRFERVLLSWYYV